MSLLKPGPLDTEDGPDGPDAERVLEEIIHHFVAACIGIDGGYERSVEVEGTEIYPSNSCQKAGFI
jgi:hypothetical protein